MKTKYFVMIAFFFFFFLLWASCWTPIQPGYVGVVVDQLGSSKGVEDDELHVGYHWIWPWKSVYVFPIFEQNYTWEDDESFNFQTSEGLAVAADVGITYNLRPECIHFIFQKYRRGMDEINHTFIRNYIRDAINKSASKMKIEDLYGLSKESFFDEVQWHLRCDLENLGFNISRIYLIGRFHVPQNVVTALNSKIEATQRAQQRENELRETEAEAKKQIAKWQGEAQCRVLEAESIASSKLIMAKAEAESNTLISKSLNVELIKSQTINRWDGKLPTMTCGENVMFMQDIR